MCSFICSSISIPDLPFVNHFSQCRGPDHTSSVQFHDYQCVHNLLSITGAFVPQPFTDASGEIACIYNGEIYNHSEFGSFRSDGECLIPLYEQFGSSFASKLDGEFAIVILDYKRKQIVVATDPFATKPLWIGFDGTHFAAASYRSSLLRLGLTSIRRVPANTLWTFDLTTLQRIETITPATFDTRQFKTSFTDWIEAFENAVRKRTSGLREKVFIGLSSGYDSGSIACELLRQNVPFQAYTIVSRENPDILEQRSSMIPNYEKILLTGEEFHRCYAGLFQTCENFLSPNYTLYDDEASAGLAAICRRAREAGCKIYISGQGADEIISDYGIAGKKFFSQSQFGGLFPENLHDYFPYNNFYGGTQMHYLAKEEHVAGSFGIETRYPFLDKFVVQEFLWLDVHRKNQSYKSPLSEYLRKNAFPFEADTKIGFHASHNLA